MLTAEQSVLIIVDVQGKLAQVMQQSAPLHQKLAILIQGAQLFDIPIIWLEQLPDKLGPTSEELSQLLSQTTQPIAKKHFSGWHCEEVKQQLNSLKRHNVILAGIETHVCVYQTCQDLLANDYQVHLVADAMSSRGTDNKVLGVQMMLNDGAKLTNVESLLFELQHVAQGDRFKALLKLIK
ncbi:hydrolase [Shewanella sp. Actino-trap-3]|jgi:nicotinamidase-related amidase|uniref:hydrolase n=1 Tax=Shewanella sp. Actino-trap-3 TaxID=2058331 RepID=UPI000C33F0B2|nr:hydrolase [Shewanella sp. Actino-trap-3]PKG78485.1 hydrolase [Shewanella sp. Actino-trap-3]